MEAKDQQQIMQRMGAHIGDISRLHDRLEELKKNNNETRGEYRELTETLIGALLHMDRAFVSEGASGGPYWVVKPRQKSQKWDQETLAEFFAEVETQLQRGVRVTAEMMMQAAAEFMQARKNVDFVLDKSNKRPTRRRISQYPQVPDVRAAAQEYEERRKKKRDMQAGAQH